MADHVRQQIREAAAVLVTGLTTTGANVHQSRAINIPETGLPALNVLTADEVSENVTIGGPTVAQMDREVTLVVEAYVKKVADADDQIDTICKEVEIALAADLTFGGLAQYSRLASTVVEYSDDADNNAAVATMSFEVIYRTTAAAPDVAI